MHFRQFFRSEKCIFPETTFLERRRRRGAVLSKKKEKKLRGAEVLYQAEGGAWGPLHSASLEDPRERRISRGPNGAYS